MTSIRRTSLLVLLITFSISSICAQDLSRYLDFQFGMDLNAVAQQTGINLKEAKTLHLRPAVVQELWWQRSVSKSSVQAHRIRAVVFSFYNGNLYRMVIEYERDRTERITDDDMIDAISASYGLAVRPIEAIVLFSSSRIYNEREKVIARWEDPQYSYSLYRASNVSAFGMLIFSKQLDKLAQSAIIEAIRLDNQEEAIGLQPIEEKILRVHKHP